MNDLDWTIKWYANNCKVSLYFLAYTVLGFRDVSKRTHGEIIAALESDKKRKLICVPRGCLKSSLACVAYPIWLLINNPDIRILIDSEIYTNSKNFLREIKSHLESPMMIKMFGEFKSEPWNEGEIFIKQRKKIYKEGSITVSGIGAVKVGQHYDYIIMDDMNSPSNTNTPENAKKVVDHYRYSTSILEPDGTLVVIGTRYADSDLIGHILTAEIGEVNS